MDLSRQLLTTEPDGARCYRRRSSAFERDVDLRGEVVADLPVALRAQFPDFEPGALISSSTPPRSTVNDLRLLPTLSGTATNALWSSLVSGRLG